MTLSSIASFDSLPLPKIFFGRGKISVLPSVAATLGTTILVVHNGGDEPLRWVSDPLQATGVHLVPWRQSGEPTLDHIHAILELARREHCTGVIGIGGGSAIDAAKAAAGLLANGGSATDYMEVVGLGKKFTQPALPWFAIPTTAGTGAEVTRNAVVGDPVKKFKASLRSDLLLASAVIIDPELAIHVPSAVTAASGMDAICQCIEAYTSKGATPLTDGVALRGVTLGAAAIRRATEVGDDLIARETMAASALLSGIALTNAGLGAVHGFAAPLGANFPIPHGVVCAALLPKVMQANAAAARLAGRTDLLSRYADVGRAMSDLPFLSTDEAIAAGIEAAASLCRDLRIPTLGHYGMKPTDVPAMVTLAKTASSMKFNPVVLSEDQLREVLKGAL